MTQEQIREKLFNCHKTENDYNREMAKLDLQIKSIEKRKAALARKVSKNMRYRNSLIEKLLKQRAYFS